MDRREYIPLIGSNHRQCIAKEHKKNGKLTWGEIWSMGHSIAVWYMLQLRIFATWKALIIKAILLMCLSTESSDLNYAIICQISVFNRIQILGYMTETTRYSDIHENNLFYELVPELNQLTVKNPLGFLYMFIFCQNVFQQWLTSIFKQI